MLKYSSFLLIASIWVCTVMCASAASNPALKPEADQSKVDNKEYVKSFLEDLSSMSSSSNGFAKILLDGFQKHIEYLEEEKKEITKTIKKGTEMERKIQSIVQTLKSPPVPLKKELRSELETIGKTASAELAILKTVNIDSAVEEVKKAFTATYNKIKEKLKKLSAIGLKEIKKTTAVQQAEVSGDSELSQLKNELSEIMNTPIKDLVASDAQEKAISENFRKADASFSKIEKGLIRAQQIEYYVKESQKDSSQSKTGSKRQRHTGNHKDTLEETDSSIRSSLRQCAFAIMFGMLFLHF